MIKYCTFQIANNKGADQTGRMRRLVCVCVVCTPPPPPPLPQRQVFSRRDPFIIKHYIWIQRDKVLKKSGNSLMEVPYLELIYDALENIGALKSSAFICQCQYLMTETYPFFRHIHIMPYVWIQQRQMLFFLIWKYPIL